ncbi:MAG: thiol-disulfide oxidoreductase DCC family protein [Gemmatimonadales bacterium]
MSNPPLLLYDGLCALCNGTVRFILARERRRDLRFAPLRGPHAREVLARHPAAAGADSVLWVERVAGQERVLTRSDAALRIAAYLGGPWRMLLVFRVVPRFLRDAVYDLIARYRYRVFGRYPECPVPEASVRARFLD